MKLPAEAATLSTMTNVASAVAPAAGPMITAAAAAAEAADAAGVTIHPVERLAELEYVTDLLASIWNPGTPNAPVSSDLLRALSHAGNYVAAAFDDGELVGATVAFFGNPHERVMHSHIAGVAARARGRNVGHALKLHQYAWALEHDVRRITWTFDPLVRRNAYFNIAKLGATPTEYLVDFYGDMSDGINAGQGSDRILVSWDVAPTIGPERHDMAPPGARVLLDEGPGGGPTSGRRRRSGGDLRLLIRVPADIEQLRVTEPALARSWRLALRDVLAPHLAAGARITSFTRTGYYVLEAGPFS